MFQSVLPAKDATAAPCVAGCDAIVSIRAFRVEGDVRPAHEAFALAGEEGIFIGGGGGEIADVMKHPAERAVFCNLR